MKIGFGAMWCLALAACGGQDGLPPVDSKYLEGAGLEPAAVTEGMPEPIVSIEVGQNQIIKFYDYGDDVLITEEGRAGLAPVLGPAQKLTNPKHDPGHFAELFAALRPDLPIPEALVALDERAALIGEREESDPRPEPNPRADGAPYEAQPGQAPQSLSGPGVTPQAPVGCNNGCCDADWTPSICQDGLALNGWRNDAWYWFFQNSGWSWANSGGSWPTFFDSTVCSAIGTSTWWNSKHAGTISVTEAHYVQVHWVCAWVCTSSMSSQANTSSAQHMHMHCGKFF